MATHKPQFINQVVSPIGVLVYPALDQPKPGLDPDKPPKYGVELLIDKKADMKALKDAVLACAQKAFPEKKFTKLSDIPGLPFADGDKKIAEADEEKKEGFKHYAGHIYIRAKSKRKPVLVDRSKQSIDADVFYAGCKVRLVLDVTSYVKLEGKKPAVTFLLNTVQFIGDGEPISGGGGVSGVAALPDDGGGEDKSAGSSMFD